MAKRALVQVILALAAQFGPAAQVNRESSDNEVLAAYRSFSQVSARKLLTSSRQSARNSDDQHRRQSPEKLQPTLPSCSSLQMFYVIVSRVAWVGRGRVAWGKDCFSLRFSHSAAQKVFGKIGEGLEEVWVEQFSGTWGSKRSLEPRGRSSFHLTPPRPL